MYRAATVAVLDAGVDLDDAEGIARAVREAAIGIGTDAATEEVTVDGVVVTDRIRGTEVTRAVSPVSAVPEVRRLLVDAQRRWSPTPTPWWSRAATSAPSSCPRPP